MSQFHQSSQAEREFLDGVEIRLLGEGDADLARFEELMVSHHYLKSDRLVGERLRYVVQVNGRKRAELTIAREADAKAVEAAALSLDAVRRALDNRPPKKVIVVPLRIVNVVV